MVLTDQETLNVKEIQKKIRERIIAENKQWKLRYDLGHSNKIHYTVGEIVYLRRVSKQTGESTKLQDKYRGPMVITKVQAGDTYTITSLSNKGNPSYTTTAYVSKLKAYHLPEEDDTPMNENESITDEDEHLPEDINQNELDNNEPLERVWEDQVESTSTQGEEKDQGTCPRPTRKIVRPNYLDDYV